MKFHLKHLVSMMAAAGALFLMQASPVHAADTDTNNGNPTFTVQSVLPDDNAKGSSFFDFSVTPNETKTISIKISNSSSQTGTFDVKPNNAVTNENGIIDYTKNEAKDPSLKLGLSDVISDYKGKQVKIAGKSTATVSFTLKMPADKFDGIILGGIVVAPHDAVKNALKANSSAKKQKSIVSTYQYVTGIRMFQKTDTVTPKISFTGVTYGLTHALPSLKVGVSNTAPTMVGISSAKVTITDKNKKKVFTKSSNDLSFAPNDSFKYFISLNNKQLTTGTYHLNLVFTNKSTKEKYTYDKDFKVTNKKQKEVKNNAADFTKHTTKTDYTWAIIIGIIALIVILGLIAYIIASRKKNKKDEETKDAK